MMDRWYVAQTQPHREAYAQTRLQGQKFRTFLPRRAKTVRHARQIKTVLAPLFPGYVFVRFDAAQARWRSINGTPGVARLLAAGEAPTPAPVGVVEALLAASDDTGKVGVSLAAGDQVRLIAGPFADALAVIERLNDTGRVAVLLKIMRGDVRVNLPADWLEKLPREP